MEERDLKGFPITFNIYARSEEEVEECRKAIISFIGLHASQCRAVTASKVGRAIMNWDKNPIVKNQIINYFNGTE
jgi:hypothetical protein